HAILLGSTIGHEFYKSNISVLAKTSKYSKRYRTNFLMIGSILTVLLILVVFGIRYVRFNRYFPIEITNSPVNNYLAVNSNGSLISVLGGYFVILVLTTLFFMLLSIVLSKYFSMMQVVGLSIMILGVLYFVVPGFSVFLSSTYLNGQWLSIIYGVITIGMSWLLLSLI
ncbi:MAG: hypothetical protein GX778_02650, partial [Erysipelothrix sp.]|nr:hypothetical protein [Erysipelothrix sp.]